MAVRRWGRTPDAGGTGWGRRRLRSLTARGHVRSSQFEHLARAGHDHAEGFAGHRFDPHLGRPGGLLEQQLWSPDGDAFAVALDAVCRVAARVTHLDGAPPPRLSRDLLIHGLAMTRVDGVDPGLSRWLRWVIDAAPVVLTAEEEGAVMECVAAMLWAIAAADLGQLDRDVGDTIVA